MIAEILWYSNKPIKIIGKQEVCIMKILIYGAGVQGSYLAHVLVRGGNEVTILARGKRFEELKKDGIVIRHYLQLKTTVDKVNIISKLLPDDIYDLIFVVMQYQQSK